MFKTNTSFRIKTAVNNLLTGREKLFLKVFLILFIAGILVLFGKIMEARTKTIPAPGGSLKEGVITNSPLRLNPLTGSGDTPIRSLVYSSLVKFSPEGKIVMDLASDFEIKEEGRVFIFNLRKNVSWHDGEKFSAEDVIFSFDAITNNRSLKSNWQGVKYKKLSPYQVQITLPNAYPAFIMNTTLPILPKHLPLASHQKKPIGTGPYEFASIKKGGGEIKKVTLKANKNYYSKTPKIKTIEIKTFKDKKNLQEALQAGKINSTSQFAPLQTSLGRKTAIQKILTPQYFAAFFNAENKDVLKEKNFRKALRKATDKTKLVESVLNGRGVKINQAIPDFILNTPPSNKPTYNLQEAKNMLKEYEQPQITITTSNTQFLKETAVFLKKQWERAGVEVKTEFFPPKQLLEQKIKTRDYEILIFGQTLSFEPDPLSFWHSRGKSHPGLNLSLYENNKADQILEEARQEMETAKRIELYQELNSIIKEDCPAIFLYSPYYLYLTNLDLKGQSLEKINLAENKFNKIENWYINEKRVWKR